MSGTLSGLTFRENETAGYFPGQHLTSRLSAIRKILPLPLEQISNPDPVAEAALSQKILAATDSLAVVQLAHILTSRELDLVFPLLAAAGPVKRPSPLSSRLTLIIRERACPSLYTSGWLTFQKYFPCQPVAQALTLLCKILEIKQQTRSDLIVQLVSPDSRHFVRRLLRRASEQEMTLYLLMQQYQIHANMPLGAELIAQSFLNGDVSLYQDSQQLFAKALQQASADTQTALLHHFLNLSGLPPNVYNRYCQEIYRQYGDPKSGHSIWSQLKSQDCQVFHEWVLAATIGSHCRRQPDKARLFQRYAHNILQIEHWDAQTILIHFPDFIIADNREYPLLALYYDQDEIEGHPFELATSEFSPNPADPAIPHRQIEDAIRRSDRQGVIGLPFDAEGIRMTLVFLDLCLLKKSRGGLKWLKRRRESIDLP